MNLTKEELGAILEFIRRGIAEPKPRTGEITREKSIGMKPIIGPFGIITWVDKNYSGEYKEFVPAPKGGKSDEKI